MTKNQKSKGFTLIELITVIVILSIIAIFIVPKFSDEDFKNDADVTRFLINIKNARHLSIVRGNNYGLKFDNNNSYSIVDKNGSAIELATGDNPILIKGTISYTVDSGQVLSNDTVYFNYLGQPLISNNNSDNLTGKIHVSISGFKVTIEPYSGGIYKE